jgi:hypothetical protein
MCARAGAGRRASGAPKMGFNAVPSKHLPNSIATQRWRLEGSAIVAAARVRRVVLIL